jgi:hypothetical protein
MCPGWLRQAGLDPGDEPLINPGGSGRARRSEAPGFCYRGWPLISVGARMGRRPWPRIPGSRGECYDPPRVIHVSGDFSKQEFLRQELYSFLNYRHPSRCYEHRLVGLLLLVCDPLIFSIELMDRDCFDGLEQVWEQPRKTRPRPRHGLADVSDYVVRRTRRPTMVRSVSPPNHTALESSNSP